MGGVLLKRSRERRRRSLGAVLRAPTWKPRYFELAQDVLRWHDDMEAMRRGAAARGMIRLHGVRLVTEIDEAERRHVVPPRGHTARSAELVVAARVFKLEGEVGPPLYLQVLGGESERRWFDALRHNIGLCKSQRGGAFGGSTQQLALTLAPATAPSGASPANGGAERSDALGAAAPAPLPALAATARASPQMPPRQCARSAESVLAPAPAPTAWGAQHG